MGLYSSNALLILLTDPSECVHLKCEWRGRGCTPPSLLNYFDKQKQKTVPNSQLLPYEIHEDDESEASILARVQKKYPLNTFTMVARDVPLGKECARRLWCSAAKWYLADDFQSLINLIKRFNNPPKFKC
ncbi:hypothetical protein B9Z55_009199 [Caenorhabditis nigoni]|nr:hypothetical protein B9Z55_009199 [Caenorhabditis nigoni]